MDRPRGSLGSLQRVVETWATGARDVEIECVIPSPEGGPARPRARHPRQAEGRGLGRMESAARQSRRWQPNGIKPWARRLWR